MMLGMADGTIRRVKICIRRAPRRPSAFPAPDQPCGRRCMRTWRRRRRSSGMPESPLTGSRCEPDDQHGASASFGSAFSTISHGSATCATGARTRTAADDRPDDRSSTKRGALMRRIGNVAPERAACHLMTRFGRFPKAGKEKRVNPLSRARFPENEQQNQQPQRQTLMANGCFLPSRISSHLLVQQCQNFALDADELRLRKHPHRTRPRLFQRVLPQDSPGAVPMTRIASDSSSASSTSCVTRESSGASSLRLRSAGLAGAAG